MEDSFSATAGGALLSNTVGPAEFGNTSLVQASQKVDSSIAIFLTFDLTAGDSASFTSIFDFPPPD